MCKKVKMSFNIPVDKREALREIAEAKGLPMTSLIILAMEEIIKKGA